MKVYTEDKEVVHKESEPVFFGGKPHRPRNISKEKAIGMDILDMITFPRLAIMIAVLGFNLLGEALRDALDSKISL